MNAASLEKLRTAKQELVEIDARAGSLRQMLLETLEDEDDICGILISRANLERSDEEIEADDEEVEGENKNTVWKIKIRVVIYIIFSIYKSICRFRKDTMFEQKLKSK